MEIKNTTNNFFDPYAAGLDKSTEARNETRLKTRAEGTGTEASQGDTVTVSQDALLLTEAVSYTHLGAVRGPGISVEVPVVVVHVAYPEDVFRCV